ncbi:uncharacterized protein conserved in bacteria [Serpentinimonas maccroryi]|uniref:Uncharacterized protein conserved in bacteria n=1 Tax=Serpentinimonas maccroryi TaxID=1458426 RepID=A0A060NMZ7_9BURK|nr:YdcH family protein [Serpentinimonas maccroryi]BAO83167.1 uncharacterized protein conserved in bacteria [Serpentinimonas maccroryi]
MFPEYRDLISELKVSDHHFGRLFEKHNELDHTIKNMGAGTVVGSQDQIETLKKEKLRLKDELYVVLKKAEAARAV